MAQLLLGAVGAGIGSVFDDPMLGFSVGSLVGGMLFPQTNSQHNKLADLKISGSAYGTMIPLAYGSMRLGGNIIWGGALKQQSSSSSSGKGQSTNTSYYTCSFAMNLCQGPITKVNRIWAEDQLIYDDSKTPKTAASIVVYLGTEVQGADPTMTGIIGVVPAYRGQAYIVFTDFNLEGYGNRIPNISVEIITANITTGAILTDIAGRAGLLVGDYDFSAATETVTGYLIPSRQGAKDVLTPMLQAFASDLVEVDGKVVYMKRGGASVVTIPPGDLGAQIWSNGTSSDVNLIEIDRQQDMELSARVDVSYYDTSTNMNYQQANQGSTRYTKQNQQDAMTISLPMAMDFTTARQIGERILYTQWTERTKASIKLGTKYIYLAPGDIITVPTPIGNIRFRITSMGIPLFGEIKLSLVQDDLNVLTQFVTGGNTNGGSTAAPLTGTGVLTAYAWHGNGLADADEAYLGVYCAASGDYGWGGADVWCGDVGVPSAQYVGRITSFSSMGTALTSLAANADTSMVDTTNTVDVQITRGLLSSCSLADLVNGANACLIGSEVVQFQTVTVIDLPTLKFRLSNLLRARRGTSVGAIAHAIGDKFVLLSAASMLRVNLDYFYGAGTTLNKSLTAYIVPANTNYNNLSGVDTNITISGAEYKPYSPCNVKGARDGSNNLTITWVRRTRSGGAWADLVDATLVDTPESYDVEIWNSTYTVLKRSFLAVASPTQIYSAANQVTDFGVIQNPVYYRIYQNNATVGRGYVQQGSV